MAANSITPEPLGMETFERSITKTDLLSSNAYLEDYILPSLPMKFSFNKIYIAPVDNSPVDYSLKAIFSKNANELQLLARKRFLWKLGIVSCVCALLLIGIIALAVVLASRRLDNQSTEAVILTTIRPELTAIDSELVNDLVEMNERTLASSTVDGVINIWDIYTYPVKSTARLSWKPHSSPAVLARLTESQLFTASLDAFDAIQLWDIQNDLQTKVYNLPASLVKSLCLVNSSRLLSGHTDSSIIIWDLDTLTAISLLTGNGGDVNKIIVLSGGTYIAAAYNSNLLIWNMITGLIKATLASNSPNTINDVIQINSDYVIVGMQDEIRFWNLNTELADGTISLPGKLVNVMCLTSNSTFAFGTSTDVEFVTFTIVTDPFFFSDRCSGNVTRTISPAHSSLVTSLIRIAWNDRLVSASIDGFIKFWTPSLNL